jgi:hypothetical protein
MITIRAGVKRNQSQPYTITIEDRIFFITHNEDRNTVEYNCFVDDDDLKNELKKILKSYLTNGINVLY